MSDDLVSRLREPLSQLPGDDDALMERVVSDRDEAATALTEARAEIEEWRQAASVEAGLRREFFTRAEKAESELSTLRARVREVVGGMLAHSCVADAGPDCKDEEDEAVERAARQLMEDLK